MGSFWILVGCFIYGCLRIGVIFAPLDLRLQVREINQCFERIKPKMYFFLGNTDRKDFRPLIREVMKTHSSAVTKDGSIKHWIQFQKETDGIIYGAMHAKTFASGISYSYIWNTSAVQNGVYELQVMAFDGAGNSAQDTQTVQIHNEIELPFLLNPLFLLPIMGVVPIISVAVAYVI